MGEIYQVFLLGLNSKHTIDVAASEADFNKTDLKTFKALVAKKLNDVANVRNNIEPGDIRLVFADKSLENEDDTFENLGIVPKSTVFMILRLPGGRG